MLCEKCQVNTATVHLQTIINNETRERHLCENCAAQEQNGFSVENLLKGLLGNLIQTAQNTGSNIGQQVPQCPRCGMTTEKFQRLGKLGCSSCYQTFNPELTVLIKKIQGGSRHEGKFPKKYGLKSSRKREIDNCRQRLKTAIEGEEFEEAAKIRDTIKEIQDKLDNGV